MADTSILNLKPVNVSYSSEFIDNLIQKKKVLKDNYTIQGDEITVVDKEWVSNQIIVPLSKLPQKYKPGIITSNAHVKFTDTSIGGNLVMNPRPQWTRYADIRADDNLVNSTVLSPNLRVFDVSIDDITSNHGMGRCYSEAIDDHKQVVYLQFGLPKFNGIMTYLMNSVNYVDLYIAKHGRKPQYYDWARTVGTIARCIAFPVTSLLIAIGKQTLGSIFGNKPFNYYYLDPQMQMYWTSVTNIANDMFMKMGILNPIIDNQKSQTEQNIKTMIKGREYSISSEDLKAINAAFGAEIINDKTNFVDVYRIATRHQERLKGIYNTHKALVDEVKKGNDDLQTIYLSNEAYYKYLESIQKYTSKTFFGWTNELLYSLTDDNKKITEIVEQEIKQVKDSDDVLPTKTNNDSKSKDTNTTNNTETSAKYNNSRTVDGYETYQSVPNAYKVNEKPENRSSLLANDENTNLADTSKSGNLIKGITSSIGGSNKQTTSFLRKGVEQLEMVSRGAYSYACLAVNHTGQSSESFSNSLGELAVGNKLKSVQQSVKHIKLNTEALAGDDTFLGKLVDGIGQVANGLIDSLTADASSLVRNLLSGAYSDIPKVWEDSDSSFPEMSFTMDLVAPYGNEFSRFQNIVLPLSMILAGALPQKVGNNTYTSPFLCSCFSRGIRHIKLGMITSVNITRGITNLNYMSNRKTNGISVSFTVTDLGHKAAAPINPTSFTDVTRMQYEQDTAFSDYLEAITSLDLYDLTYKSAKIKLALKGKLNILNNYVSSSRIFGAAGDIIENSPLSIFFGNNVSLSN